MREVRRGIFALSALILVTGCISNPAFAADNQGGTSISPSDDSANNDAVLKTTENHRLAETMAAMENLGILGAHSEYRELIAQTALLDEQTLEVRYWNGGKGSPELARTLASIGDTLPMRVVTVPVSFDPAQLNDLARRISENDPATLTALGLPRVDSVAINTETGELIVYAAQKPDARSVEVDGELLEVDEGVQTIFQHRQDDAPPWSGGVVGRGDALLSTTPDCTFGFNWRKSTGELMGSTAEHCFELGGIGTWYNYGSQIGSRYYYSTDRDTTLIRSSGGLSRFNPNVFVGAANTNEIRWVVQGMPSEPVGGAIALSGGRSGLHVGSILNVVFYTAGKGPWREKTVSACLGGDSGGPWLTTKSGSGDVVAHGQHGGIRHYPGLPSRCFYMPVTYISNALSASLYLH